MSTEENYVEDLHCVLFGYRDRLEECEERVRQKSEEIFGNLEEIYDFHSQVLNRPQQEGSVRKVRVTVSLSVLAASAGAVRGGHEEAGQDLPGVQRGHQEDLLQVLRQHGGRQAVR